jgi:3-phenylpropionate/cinnamic acid dioxygenase small subunit
VSVQHDNHHPAAAGTDETHAGFADQDTHVSIRLFLEREAELIDDRRYRDWLTLVSDDFTYLMPVTFTPDNPAKPHYDPDAYIVDETRETLAEHWFRRFEPDMWEIAWSENPPVRYRHFISNVRVRTTDHDGFYDVRSNVLLAAARQSDQPTLLTAERFDLVGRRHDDWQLRRRMVILDTTSIQFAHLRVVF